MAIRQLNLIAPNSAPIVGIKLDNGKLAEFVCTYDDTTRTFLYVLSSENAAKVLESGGTNVLIDAKGNEWSAPDVEIHSVLNQ